MQEVSGPLATLSPNWKRGMIGENAVISLFSWHLTFTTFSDWLFLNHPQNVKRWVKRVDNISTYISICINININIY